MGTLQTLETAVPAGVHTAETGDGQVKAVLAAVVENVRARYADRPQLADQTAADLQAKLGHHTDLKQFVLAAQVEGIGDELRNVADKLEFRTQFTAILRNAEKARYAKNS
ncbi:MAG: hypothetical protein HOO67_07285 [Candidatus Peribacteraceae bacterium]|nr:hypothetical protein [Candidatus Peribacteraceae bacterium]